MKNWTLAFLLIYFFPVNQVFSINHSAIPLQKTNASIAEFLNGDGTLTVPMDFSGTLNLTGFEVYIDACNGVIARPQKNKPKDQIKDGTASLSGWMGLPGLNSFCWALAVMGGDIYAGGAFTVAGGVTVNHIAKWNGSTWSSLGRGLNGSCLALAVSGSDLYVGGFFDNAGGVFVRNIAKWDGSRWSPLGEGLRGLNGGCRALAVSGSDLYAGGSFSAAGFGISTQNIARWNGSNWSALGAGLNATCLELGTSSSGEVYAGGSFTSAGGVIVNRIAKWDGNNWSALGTGLNNVCEALYIEGTNVYAGGAFTIAGGVNANRIAKWDGNSWSPLGGGLSSTCLSITAAGGYLYAAGQFTNVGGNYIPFVARWDGSNWSSLGGIGTNSRVWSIAVTGNEVYVGGDFSFAGGIPSTFIAKFSDVLLPVETVYFRGRIKENKALLSWQTANENNNKGFEVQRSSDGVNWKPIGFVTGAGTSTTTQDYQFTDSQPGLGTNFYRLKQIDFDGQFEYSKVIVIKFESEVQKIGELFPNPSRPGIVRLTYDSESDKSLLLTVLDGSGKALFSRSQQLKEGRNQLELNCSTLGAGVYFVKLESDLLSVYRTLILE